MKAKSENIGKKQEIKRIIVKICKRNKVNFEI